ncbi:hypothetical protein JTB14_016422 [Gonioctena quinquepunctata]|nr:hypothetical protein JTB14_016422 [Gonioctena quinquepunctata]
MIQEYNTCKEEQREVDRQLRKVGRDIEKDRRQLEREEHKLELEIKKTSQGGNTEGCKIIGQTVGSVHEAETSSTFFLWQ